MTVGEKNLICDFTYCLYEDCRALSIGINTEADFVVWLLGLKIGTVEQAARERQLGVRGELTQFSHAACTSWKKFAGWVWARTGIHSSAR